MPHLQPALVETVLDRLGLPDAPAPDAAGLASLYDAWCRQVPFDNVRKRIAVHAGDPGPLPGDAPDEFLRAWLSHGVGGTCWAGNGALCALLQALGFDAHRGVATMLVAPDLPPNHGTVVVALTDGPHLLDASILHVAPLPVADGETVTVDHPAWGVTGHWAGGQFAVRWRGFTVPEPFDCRLEEWPVDARRFSAQHEMTRDWSPFNYELMFTTIRGDERVGIARGEAVRIDAAGTVHAEPLRDRLGWLIDGLGVEESLARRIPDDQPTPPPPGSRTARGG